MKTLLVIRNKIESFIAAHSMVCGYVFRLIFALASLLALRSNLSYNTLLSNVWFIIGFSAACAFLPVRFMALAIAAYTIVQVCSLSLGIGMVMLAMLVIIYLVYIRFNADYGYALLLMPVLFILKLPIAIPLVLAVAAPVSSIVVVIFGCIIYYSIHYIAINSAVFIGMSESLEITKVSVFLNGMTSYSEFIYTTIFMIIMFLAVYYLKKVNVRFSKSMAIAAGCGIFMIFSIIANLVFATMTSGKLLSLVLGTIGAGIIAIIAGSVIMPIDYSRTEYLEFEDDEYVYYVRAIPKANIEKENVRITRINIRKENP